jgi:uncharacterized membrane protein (DUF2068 family)
MHLDFHTRNDTLPAMGVTGISDRGVALVALYKLVRGGSALLASVVLAVMVLTGRAPGLHDLFEHLSAHWTSGVSSQLARFVLRALEARHVWMVTGALALDGAFTLLESFALYRGYAWGPWLVVGATSLLLPVEAVAWFRRPTFGRALIALLNALVAAYLARRAVREQRHTTRVA